MNSQKYKEVNPFILFVFFIAAVIVALPLRVYQLMTNIEAGTGFWIDKTHFSVIILYIVLAIGTVLPIVLSLIYQKGLGKTTEGMEKKTVGGIISLVSAAGFLVDAVLRYRAFTEMYNAFSSSFQTESLATYLSKSGALATGLEAFFAVLSAIFFLMFGIALLTGKDPSEYKLLAIMPVFWAIFRIMYRFMRKISFLNVSDLFLELMMIVFLLMFYMAFAQVTARVGGKGMEWKLFAYGLPAALFCLLCFIPRVVITLLGKGEWIAEGSSVELVDLCCALFVIYVLVDRSRVFRAEVRSKGTLAQ